MIISNFIDLKDKVIQVANRLDPDSDTAQSIEEKTREILTSFKNSNNKLESLKELSKKFDNKDISDFRVDCTKKFDELASNQKGAIKLAVRRIEKFQKACLPKDYSLVEDKDLLKLIFKPVDSVGIYVPGGSAPLLSTLMMTAIPAKVAGVKRIALVSPPKVHNYILAVADYLGIQEIYQIGGVQAIASLTYGVEEIGLLPVDKIVGPGNPYVTIAKKLVFGKVGIDALYGPSELVIIADEFANPKLIAHDLMSQLEHGSGYEAACLFTNSQNVAEKVITEFEIILENQPNKANIKKAWSDYGIIGLTETLEQCAELSNLFAPEHLEIKVKKQSEILSLIKHAGAIFTQKSNEALGDYLVGPSHCLPTGRSARFSSGLSVMDFLKRSSFVDINPSEELIEATAVLARMEGLEAHAQAALSFKNSY
ncbi:MAG: histidinol dehydrogenase [Candidatus Caenarcaniphilales bacterium]|nr:histidinol dehydrogenase [Candidatus Caenarcaniphilales bacterium]